MARRRQDRWAGSGGRGAVPAAVALCVAAALAAGCRPPAVTFPARPVAATDTGWAYDTTGDGKGDFFFLANAAGRFDRIAYDRDGDGSPDYQVNLDAIDRGFCRHLVIVLDGIPFDVLKDFHDAGHLRVFHPPAVVIPPYPVLTDPALEDAFGFIPCEGYEAKYVRRSRREVAGGTGDYLAGRNEPFVGTITYRGPTGDDALAYLKPRLLFEKELNQVKRVWDRRRQQEVIAYLVSTAALGSRLGEEGQLLALRQCERLIHQVIFETGGLVKVTLFADHGQTNVPCKPAGLARYLKSKGWRLVRRPRRRRDVAMIEFGLVTCAAFGTPDPAALAEDLAAFQPVELVSYVQGDAVVVRGRHGQATIRSGDGKTFQYACRRGDPLDLARLAGSGIDGRELLRATVRSRHNYPDALYRLWRAHFALVENPPDVVVTLDDRYYNGAGLFAGAVTMASTHGGLNWRNSATFFMTTAAAVEGPLRSEDIPGRMRAIFGRPFPAGR